MNYFILYNIILVDLFLISLNYNKCQITKATEFISKCSALHLFGLFPILLSKKRFVWLFALEKYFKKNPISIFF